MSGISGGIASIELVRKQLEEAQVRRLRLETRCNMISTTVKNMEKLLSEVNGTMGHLDEELQNVNKWNNFYDGNLQDAYRSLSMLKETRDKKWNKYELDAKSIRMKIAEKEKELEDRKESYDRNIELIWKKIPAFVIKEEKRQAIMSLTDRMNNMGIETLPQGRNDKLNKLMNKKMELESQLKIQNLDLENWQNKLTENKVKSCSTKEASQALENELKKVKAIEMALHTKVLEAKHSDTENHSKEDMSIELKCNAGDSGIMSMDGDIPRSQDELVNSSVHDQSLDSTMFEERPEAPMKPTLPRTPSKNEVIRAPGPMHSTPHNSTSNLSEFLRPKKSGHCSVPPNMTPIINSSLSNSRILTPMNTFQKLDTKSAVGNLQSFRHITPMKKSIATAYTAEVTPVKTNFISSLPKTPISMVNKSKSMILPTSANKDFAMNRGLLAPTPEKENVLNVTPPKQILPTPVTPSAPIKNLPALPNRISMASNQPESKKLKPSNSFTKVQKPLSPQNSFAQQAATPATAASQMVSTTPKKPNERGDYEDAKFTGVDSIGIGKGSPAPIAVDEREKDQSSQSSSPFGGFNFPGGPPFGEDGTFGVGQGFGGGQGFSSETGFSGEPGFAAESNFGGGSTFGGSAGFGSASGDSSNFSSGFGGFNF